MIGSDIAESVAADSQAIEFQVDQFVERQRQHQLKLESEKRRPNQTISDLIHKSKSLPPEIVDNIFNPYLERKIDDDSVAYVRKRLHSMRLKINTMEAKKQFLVLETMDFFRSKISIGKLIPAILLLTDLDKKKAFLQFVIPTFNSIRKNVETLVSTNQLFTEKTLHLNRGSLYSFISDLAKTILPVFKPIYLERFNTIASPVELLETVLSYYFSKHSKQRDIVFNNMVDDDHTIRKVLLDFIVAIQSHEALFNYAVKRHGYYKLFITGLTDKERFEECDPVIISKILAGCFIANKQIKPSNALINAMVDKERFDHSSTTKAKKSFIDKLSPSTVVTIVSQFKTYFRLLLSSNEGDKFAEVSSFSVKTILKNTWSGFTRLAEEGFSKVSAPIEIVINQIRKTFLSFIEDENQANERFKNRLNNPIVTLIPKRSESYTYLKKSYSMVTPSVMGFRGMHEGANQKDFAYNSRFFKKGEVTLLEFTYCFNRLFEALVYNNNKKVKVITHNRKKNIVEYHTSFLYNNYLICLGLTRLKKDTAGEVEEKDMFPYVLLFSESGGQQQGRLPERVLTVKGRRKVYTESVMQRENMKILYKSILYILHLLPVEDWNASSSQACIKFIIRELKRQTDHP